MINNNIITEKQYHTIRGIIRGELAHFTCYDYCRRLQEEIEDTDEVCTYYDGD